MIRSLVKLQFKLAILPLRVARILVKKVLEARREAPRPTSFDFGAVEPTPQAAPASAETSPLDFQIDPSDVLRRVSGGESLVFVDVRQAEELAATGMIEGALHIPTQDLPRRMSEIDPEGEVFVYCAAGVRSLDATVFLREKGYSRAWSLGGGLPHWEQDGGQVVQA